MKITKKLSYGVNENTPKEFLYIRRIILRSYDNEENNKKFMETLKYFKIFQYNCEKAQDSDYFMWQYVDDKGNRDWKHIDLSSYMAGMDMVYNMYKLYAICKETDIDINAEVQFGDIRTLISKLEY